LKASRDILERIGIEWNVVIHNTTSRWGRHGLAAALVCLTAVVIYSNTFQAPFVFDDQHTIQENAKIRDLSNFYTPDILRSPRPLSDFTFALNYHFGKLRVFGYHLVNLLIHIANSILVLFLSQALFRKLSRPDSKNTFMAALFAAMVFVAHPLQTQAVTYVAQRYTSLAAFFYLASVLAYLAARDANSGQRPFVRQCYFLTSFLCGVFAFLCKQNSASLPLAILIVEYTCYDQSWQGWRKKLWIILAGVLLFGVVYAYNMGVFRHEIQFSKLLDDVSEKTQETRGIGRWRYLCTQFNVICVYIRLLVIPVQQSIDHAYPFKTGFFDGATPFAFIFLVGIVAVGWWRRKTSPVVFFGISWFFVALSVESSIFPIRDAMFEHRLYLPMFGFSLLVAHACERLFSKRRLPGYVLAMVVILLFSVAAHARNAVWRDDITLWSDVVSKNPLNFRGFNNLGYLQMERGDFKAAMVNYDKALRLRPDYCLSLSNKGVILERMGQIDPAIALFRKALEFQPDFFPAVKNLSSGLRKKADLMAASGKYREAIELYKESIRVMPKTVEGYTNLGVAYSRIGNKQEAINHFKEALKIDPGSAEASANMGSTLYSQGKIAEALQYLTTALRLKPDSEEIRNNIAIIINLTRTDPNGKSD
jgi:tetratricopeptide (TPR) repeat protein